MISSRLNFSEFQELAVQVWVLASTGSAQWGQCEQVHFTGSASVEPRLCLGSKCQCQLALCVVWVEISVCFGMDKNVLVLCIKEYLKKCGLPIALVPVLHIQIPGRH